MFIKVNILPEKQSTPNLYQSVYSLKKRRNNFKVQDVFSNMAFV